MSLSAGLFSCVCTRVCLSRGQWEWWVCKRVTSSGLYIAPPSSPRLSLGAVLKFQTQLFWSDLHKEQTLLNCCWQLKDSHKTTREDALYFKTTFQCKDSKVAGATEGWLGPGGGAEAKVETEHIALKYGAPTRRLIYTSLCWSSTVEYLSIPVGRVHSQWNKSLLTLWHHLLHCDCSSEVSHCPHLAGFTLAMDLPVCGFLPVSFGSNVGYSYHEGFLSCLRHTSFTLPACHFLKDGASHF